MMTQARPNVLFLFTDDQRFDTIHALGNRQIKTPNLDALVARGTTFTHAHIPCGTSGAVCMPSRAMLHSGRTLFHLHDGGASIPPEHTTMGQAFRQAGYQTFGTGKWHNGTDTFQRSFTDGEEIFFGGMADHWNVPAFHYDPTGRYDQTRRRCPNPYLSNDVEYLHCDHINAGRHSTESIAECTIEFFDKRDPTTPFFAYVSFLAPHDPRTMPEEFRQLYDPADIDLPPNFMGGHPFDNGALRIRDEELAGFPRHPDETRRHIAEYYAMISHLDHHIGRIVAALDANGELDNTIVVMAGDNGLAVGQHGLFGKQNCYDHSVRIPLILAGPGIPQGQKRDAFAYLFDLFPTLCELADLPIPTSVEGSSLTKALRDPDEHVRETLYFAYCGFQRAVRDRRYKLIEYVVNNQPTQTQLFDLDVDPWEMHNLADDPAHSERRAALRQELRRYSIEWGDTQTPWGRHFWPPFEAGC